MSNGNNNKAGQVTHALKVVREEIKSLAEKINAAPAGAERDKLEAQMKEVTGAIGLQWEGLPDMPTAPTPASEITGDVPVASVGKAILKSMSEAPHVAGSGKTIDELADAATQKINAAVVGLSFWQRTKLCYTNNKKKFWAGLALVLGAAAGAAYYFVKVKNSEAVSSAMAMAETGATEAAPETTEAASASIFARIGDWIVTAAKATKDFVVNGVSKLVAWVKNLFNNTNKETTNGQPEAAAPEAVPA